MRNKTKFNLIFLAMIISLIGVGFAAWTINVPTPDVSENGDFIADNVILVEALSSPVFDNELRYNNHGFYTQHTYDVAKNEISSITYDKLTYSIDVDLPQCSTKLPTADKFQLRIRLKDNMGYENINAIYELITTNIAINNLNSYSVDKSIDTTTNEIVLNIDITSDKIGSNISKVSVTFDFSNVSINETDAKNIKALKEGFFLALSKVEKDRAFVVAASLYAIYND